MTFYPQILADICWRRRRKKILSEGTLYVCLPSPPPSHPHPSSSSHPIPILIPPRKLILFSPPRASSTQRLATPLEAEAEGQKVGARSILCAFEKSSKTREDNESFVFLHRQSTRESLLLLPRVLRHEPLGSHSLSLGSTPNAKACVQVAYSGM